MFYSCFVFQFSDLEYFPLSGGPCRPGEPDNLISIPNSEL